MRGMTGNKVEMLIDESYTYEGTTSMELLG